MWKMLLSSNLVYDLPVIIVDFVNYSSVKFGKERNIFILANNDNDKIIICIVGPKSIIFSHVTSTCQLIPQQM